MSQGTMTSRPHLERTGGQSQGGSVGNPLLLHYFDAAEYEIGAE